MPPPLATATNLLPSAEAATADQVPLAGVPNCCTQLPLELPQIPPPEITAFSLVPSAEEATEIQFALPTTAAQVPPELMEV